MIDSLSLYIPKTPLVPDEYIPWGHASLTMPREASPGFLLHFGLFGVDPLELLCCHYQTLKSYQILPWKHKGATSSRKDSWPRSASLQSSY
jgi:hypothetical protein